MKKIVAILAILLASALILILVFTLTITELEKKNSFKLKMIGRGLDLKLPAGAELDSFNLINQNVGTDILFKKILYFRAIVKIKRADLDYFRDQLTNPPWEPENGEGRWSISYWICSFWARFDFDNKIGFWHNINAVYEHKSEASSEIATFPGNNEDEVFVGFDIACRYGWDFFF